MPDERIDPDYDWRSFISLSESYGTAAFTVAAGRRLPHLSPIGTLGGHCMELALKAVLLFEGATAQDLRKHGHDLNRLLASSGLDWSDLDQEVLTFFADAMREHAFRYIDRKRYFSISEGGAALNVCEAVFQRCLAKVLPGASRTLRC